MFEQVDKIDSLFDDKIIVESSNSFRTKSIILDSVSESTLDKASSRMSIFGFDINALARAILCFCPPDKVIPPPQHGYLFHPQKTRFHHKLLIFLAK